MSSVVVSRCPLYPLTSLEAELTSHSALSSSVMLGCTVQSWGQLTGMNVMMYYVIYVFREFLEPLLPISLTQPDSMLPVSQSLPVSPVAVAVSSPLPSNMYCGCSLAGFRLPGGVGLLVLIPVSPSQQCRVRLHQCSAHTQILSLISITAVPPSLPSCTSTAGDVAPCSSVDPSRCVSGSSSLVDFRPASVTLPLSSENLPQPGLLRETRLSPVRLSLRTSPCPSHRNKANLVTLCPLQTSSSSSPTSSSAPSPHPGVPSRGLTLPRSSL